MKKSPITLLLMLICFVTQAQNTFKLTQIGSGFNRPLEFLNCGDNRSFIVSQKGLIYILDSVYQQLPNPFLDIDSKVVNSGNERGLLGLAFHPDYKTNGFFYVDYSNNNGNNVIARYSVDPNNPNLADPNSEVILLTITQPYTNHNGGCLRFGPDGYLYIASGDGGSGGDPQGNAQNLGVLLGKILRIDVNNGTPYGIPADNPFINTAGAKSEIWSYGWRNPWRYSFDALTGDLWAGDVGQDIWEEVDFLAANSTGGENMGWRCYEGDATFNSTGCSDISNYTFPVHTYKQDVEGCSVTGGFLYRGSKFPGLYGKYIYCDYCTGKFWMLYKNKSGEYINKILLDGTDLNFGSFGEDKDSELFACGLSEGKIYKISMECPDFQTTFSSLPTCGDEMNGSITTTTSGGTGKYEWQWNTGSTESSISNLAEGSYSLTVVDDGGCGQVVDLNIDKISLNPLIEIDGDSLFTSFDSSYSYQWWSDTGVISGANLPYFISEKSGNYYVVVTTKEGCNFDSDVVNFFATKTNNPSDNQFALFPNPAKNEIRITSLSNVGAIDLTLYDIVGNILEKLRAWDQSLPIPIGNLLPGQYLIRIIMEERIEVMKFIKK